jgi:hypothetical protein
MSTEIPGILRPSSAALWGVCAGSLAMQARYPQEEGEEARLGTAAHWVVTETMENRPPPVGAVAPNGVVTDDEMHECGALFYAAAVMAGMPRWIERKLTMHKLVHPACEGTPDLGAVDHGGKTIDVIDYKYGHRYVDPFRNFQLCLYVAGLLEANNLTWDMVKGWQVRLTIVQPRNYHPDGPVRTWDTLGWKVREVVDALYVAARAAKAPDALCSPNDDCIDCTARHACPALREVGYAAMDVAGKSLPLEMTPAALGLQLDLINRAETRLKAQRAGLEEVAKASLRAGKDVPGWGIKQGTGRERWTVPPETVVMIGQGFGVELDKPATLTPNQARQAGIPPDVVTLYAEKPPGEHKLVPVNMDSIARAFG